MAERIPIYNAPIRQPEVPTTGIEQLARAGYRMGQIGQEEQRLDTQAGQNLARGLDTLGRGVNQVGTDVEQHQTINDLTGFAAAKGPAFLNLSQQFNDFLRQNQNDPNAAAEFHERYVQPVIDHMLDQANTAKSREAVEEWGSTLTEHFAQMGMHTLAAVAGQQAGQSLGKLGQAYAAAVVDNPAALPMALKDTDATTQQLIAAHPNLTPQQVGAINADAEKTKQDYIYRASQSYIAKTLEQGGQPDLNKFLTPDMKATLGGDKLEELNRTTQAAQHQIITQANEFHTFQKNQRDDLSDQNSQAMVGALINPQTGQLIGSQDSANWRTDVLSLVGAGKLTRSTGEALLNMQTRLQEQQGKTQTNPAVFQTMMQRAGLDPSDPARPTLEEAYGHVGKDLSDTDAKMVIDAIGRRTPEDISVTKQYNSTLSNFGTMISSTTPILDAQGKQLPTLNPLAQLYAQSEFASTFNQAFARARAAGAEATAEFFNPNTPSYWGKQIDIPGIMAHAVDNALHPAAFAAPAAQTDQTGKVVPIPQNQKPPPSLSNIFGLIR